MAKPVARERKQKRRRKLEESKSQQNGDSNAFELLPESATAKEQRRQELRAQLKAQQQPSKATSKKNKRLEKYIDKKLRKDETSELIRKLENQKIDTSLFRSSRKLGRANDTQRERLARIIQEQRAGVASKDEVRALYEQPNVEDSTSEDDDFERSPPHHNSSTYINDGTDAKHENSSTSVNQATATFGAGLKRPLEKDAEGNVVITKRTKVNHRAPAPSSSILSTHDDEDEWAGFTSTSAEEDAEDFSDRADEEQEAEEDESMSESDESEYDSETRRGAAVKAKERSSVFKAWADEQRNKAADFIPTNSSLLNRSTDSAARPEKTTGVLAGLVSQSIPVKNTINAQQIPLGQSSLTIGNVPVHTVLVERDPEVQEARLKLPVVAEEQQIMEKIQTNECTIICGPTGSGKTTQIPQFLFEAGFGNKDGPKPGSIAITQPRRVAAISMSRRVAFEMKDTNGKVSHQVRFDSSISNNTAIEFVTDGVLLRRIAEDFILDRYSVVIIDEAHERTVNTDLLIGLLSRIVEVRRGLSVKNSRIKPLKLIIMSATLSISDLAYNKSLFPLKQPPVVKVEGRQYPVTIHFARRTNRDYMEEIFNKVSKGHTQLPPGGFLVFLTGQAEIETLSRRLEEKFESTIQGPSTRGSIMLDPTNEDLEVDDYDDGNTVLRDQDFADDDASESDIDIKGVDNKKPTDDDNDFMTEPSEDEPASGGKRRKIMKLHILPLYSALPQHLTQRIYEPVPADSRLVILATNVAETSITVPIRYVFDCGRSKQRRYDPITGIQSFEVGWVSKASAEQRSGRSGRLQAGHCWRLYSSAVYERDFPDVSPPEIHVSTAMESVILILKSLGVPSVPKFPWPSAPDTQELLRAEQLLEHLGALDAKGGITKLGKELAVYPLSPRLSRIIVAAQALGCLEHALALVAIISAGEVFIPEAQLHADTDDSVQADRSVDQKHHIKSTETHKDHASFMGRVSRLDRHSDAIKLLTCLHDFLKSSPAESDNYFRRFARLNALMEADKLRGQLISTVNHLSSKGQMSKLAHSQTFKEPSPSTIKRLRQAVIAGYLDQIAIRSDTLPQSGDSYNSPRVAKPKRVSQVPYTTLIPTDELRSGSNSDNDIYVHPSSVLCHTCTVATAPKYIVYSHLTRSAARAVAIDNVETSRTKRIVRMHPLAPTSDAQILALIEGTNLMVEGKPLKIETLERSTDCNNHSLERRAAWCVPFLRSPQSASNGAAQEWPLGVARRIVQVRLKGQGWVNEHDHQKKIEPRMLIQSLH